MFVHRCEGSRKLTRHEKIHEQDGDCENDDGDAFMVIMIVMVSW